MEVKGVAWLGIRTAEFEPTVALFRDVMGLEVTREERAVVGLQFPDGTEMGVRRPEDEFHSFFSSGPVVGFLLDDVDAARAQMEAAGSSSSDLSNGRAVLAGATSADRTGTSTRSSVAARHSSGFEGVLAGT